ncbi:cytochrome P450 [Mycena epipterygia]|nr:cytochrome P450 [Mycena epipterygia]
MVQQALRFHTRAQPGQRLRWAFNRHGELSKLILPSLGYLLDLHKRNSLSWHLNIPEEFGHVARLKGGILGVCLSADALYVTDPAALHAILVKQQACFPESTEFIGLFGVINVGDGLASVNGPEHRKQRKFMDTFFTHVSALTPMFYQVAHQLRSELTTALSGKPHGQVVNVLDYLGRAALEIIGTTGFGHSFNSFDDKSPAFNEFYGGITSVLPVASRLFLVMPFLDSWRKIRPVWLRRTLASIASFPWSTARKLRAIINIIHPMYARIYNSRKETVEEGGLAALAETVSGGKDLITSIIQANWAADEAGKMSDANVIANMSALVQGGHETTSSSIARCLCLLSADTGMQQKLRLELQEAKAKKSPSEDLDFSELERFPLLDAFVREVLRVYSPVTFIWRQTIKDVVVPLTYPIRSTITGEETNQLLITQGTAVYLGLGAANRSTAIWGPDAAEFKPERWLDGNSNKSKLPGGYSGMMTFLAGAKVCPGRAFAILQIKLVLSVLLLAFSFEPISEPIDWSLSLVLEPRVRGRESEGAQAPLRVTKL